MTNGQSAPSTGNAQRIVIAMGDPAGIGPEVTVKALASEALPPGRFIIAGDRAVLERAAQTVGIAPSLFDRVEVRQVDALGREPVEIGRLDARYGAASVEYVRVAAEMCIAREADAMVTGPVNKEAVTLSGMPFTGHTEYIAALCGATDSRMLLVNDTLAVVHVTTHVALRRACDIIGPRLERTIRLGLEAMQWLGKETPRVAVCGLNPHAGEHGLFGDEDDAVIAPVIDRLRGEGLPVNGPLPADTLFHEAANGRWDLVIANYHDQGHVPMKVIDFARTVNVTLGIPIIRTSVDHGTAFNIAGRNLADARSMQAALAYAVRFATGRSQTAAAGTTGRKD
jgi:4-hydroxythreonine-4-phosphate dehydrogenase